MHWLKKTCWLALVSVCVFCKLQAFGAASIEYRSDRILIQPRTGIVHMALPAFHAAHGARVLQSRIILEELERLGWKASELRKRAKGDIDKMAIAARLRRETTLTMHWVAARLHCGTWKSLTGNLYRWKKQVNTDSA